MWQAGSSGAQLYPLTLSTIFSLILVVGMVGTFLPYDTVPTLRELRSIAPLPSSADLKQPLLLPGKITVFFGDNFGGRKPLLREYFRLRLRVLQADVGLPAVLGKNGWLLSSDEVLAYRNDPTLMSPEKVERMRKVLSSWCTYVRARGAVMVFLVGPNKTTIHPVVPDYLPRRSGPSIIDRMNDLKIDCPLIKVDLRKTLSANAEHPLYFKWGTHWNNSAGVLVWKAIKEAVAQSGHRLKWPTSQMTMSRRPAAPWEDSLWIWFGLTDPEQSMIPTPSYSERKYEQDSTGSAIPRAKVLAFGDSFLAWLRPTVHEVADTYSDWSSRPYDALEYTPDDLETDAWIAAVVPKQRRIEIMNVFKPNVVILEIVERGIDNLADLPIPADVAK